MAQFTSARSFLTHLKDFDPQPGALLLACNDQVRIDQFVSELCKIVFEKSIINQLERKRVDASEMNATTLVQLATEIHSPSLFSPAQFFHLQNVASLKGAVVEEFVKLVTDVPSGVFLLLTDSKVPATSKLRKRFQKDKLFLELKPFTASNLSKWVAAHLRKAGVLEFSTRDVETLITLGNESPDAISHLIDQLALFVEDGSLQRDEIFELFISQPDPNEFSLIDAITTNNMSEAEILLAQLMRAGKSPFLMLNLLARTFLNYVALHELQKRGKSSSEIQTQLAMKPWVMKKGLQAVKRYPAWKIECFPEAILAADMRLKNKSLGPELVLSELVHDLRP